jgi:GNAT superfamily N-acetyltransferase
MTLWRVRATVDDRPGFLAVLTASLALRAMNILSVQVHGTEAGAVDDFLVDAPGELTEADIYAAVVRGRGRDPWVRRTEAHHLVDPPTEMLGAAARLVRDPDGLAETLGTALLAQVSRIAGPESTHRAGFNGGRMRLDDPAGGTLLVERDAPPYTPAEYARARALVEVASEVRRRAGVRWMVALPVGDEIEIRGGTDADAEAVTAMLDRCSPETRRARFARPAQAHASSRGAIGYPASSLVAVTGAGLVVGLGSIAFDGPDAELSVVVEDAAQRRGIGTALARRLVDLARAGSAEVVHAYSSPDNTAMSRTFDRLGLDVVRAADGPVMTLSAAVAIPSTSLP